MSFSEFLEGVCRGENGLLLPVLLVVGVIFVNGWTDAPNAITASVSTGALKLRSGIALAAVCNFAGAIIMGIANTSVLKSVEDIAFMISGDEGSALPILSAALIAIILWAVAAWYFGIPTSESHALISGILGAAIAYNEGIENLNLSPMGLAISGLLLSLPIGFVGGAAIGKVLEVVSYNTKLLKNRNATRTLQRIGSAAMAFMHGAQDSQKFAGVFAAALAMGGEPIMTGATPLWLTLLCSSVISLGTAVGGYRIIKRVGMDTVKLNPIKAISADMSAAACMLTASMLGMPVSTTHTSTASVIGAGVSSYPREVNLRSVREMLVAWLLTFPCCGMISYFAVKLYMFFG